MNRDVHALAGAYALDALPAEEREQFEAHLGQCDTCPQEVRELRETTARLGAAAAEAPPAGLKERVMADITRTRQVPPVLRPAATRRGGLARGWARDWVAPVLAVAAAVMLVVAVGLGAQVARLQHRLDEQGHAQASARAGAQAEMAAVLTAPDAQTVRAVAGGGSGVAVVSRTRGEAVFTATGMPALPASKAYQMWFIDAGTPRSAAVLPAGGTTAPVLARDLAAARQIALTVEPAGGSRAPTTSPVMVLTLPT